MFLNGKIYSYYNHLREKDILKVIVEEELSGKLTNRRLYQLLSKMFEGGTDRDGDYISGRMYCDSSSEYKIFYVNFYSDSYEIEEIALNRITLKKNDFTRKEVIRILCEGYEKLEENIRKYMTEGWIYELQGLVCRGSLETVYRAIVPRLPFNLPSFEELDIDVGLSSTIPKEVLVKYSGPVVVFYPQELGLVGYRVDTPEFELTVEKVRNGENKPLLKLQIKEGYASKYQKLLEVITFGSGRENYEEEYTKITLIQKSFNYKPGHPRSSSLVTNPVSQEESYTLYDLGKLMYLANRFSKLPNKKENETVLSSSETVVKTMDTFF